MSSSQEFLGCTKTKKVEELWFIDKVGSIHLKNSFDNSTPHPQRPAFLGQKHSPLLRTLKKLCDQRSTRQ